jgi:hypothetical protein
MEKAFRDVKYYNNSLYYKIDKYNKEVLLNKKRHLKKCIIIDVTTNKVYNGVKEWKKDFPIPKHTTDEEIVNIFLEKIKFKVYKKIKVGII